MPTGYAARKLLRSALPGLLFAAQLVQPAYASSTDPLVPLINIAKSPLFNSAILLVKPNVLFMLDDSSSMAYNYLPDEVPRDITLLGNPDTQTDSHKVGLTSSQCNGVAYNPAFTYSPPVDSNGTPFVDSSGTSSNAADHPDVKITSAPNDGFNPLSATTSLTSAPIQFYYVYGSGGIQTPLSYTYQSGVVDTTTTFYQECNVTTVASPSPATLGRFTKVLVTSLTVPQKQNYANWYSYYRTRLLMMKTLAGQSFNGLTDSFRVGLSTIHDKGADETATFLPITDFAAGVGSQKEKFFAKLYGVSANAAAVPQQYTPTRGALAKAGRIYAGKFFTGGVFPGGSTAEQLRDPMQYSCQQNFTLLASDGYWNSTDDKSDFGPFALDNIAPVGDQDGGATPPPLNGTLADGTARANTLADVAMYYYQTDLRNPNGDLANPGCTSGSTGQNLCPVDSTGAYAPNVPGNKVDNNIKPHMTTFTVGLAINGMLGYSPSYAEDTSGDYFLIKTGAGHWTDARTLPTPFPYDGTIKRQVIERVDDLWHAAVNGRGTYFSAKNPATLVSGLKAALGGVASRLGYGNAGATSSLAPILGDNALYVASYVTGQWTGNLVAQSIDTHTGEVNPAPSWCVEDVPADLLLGTSACIGTLPFKFPSKSSDTRAIYFNSGGTLTPFLYGNLSAAQKLWFDNSKLSQSTLSPPWTTVATGTTLVNYLRGQSQYEYPDGTDPNLYRQRLAKLGDIVDSQPVFLGKPFFQYSDPGYQAWKNAAAQQNRPRTVFASANDGMLHAFNADVDSNGNPGPNAGKEVWAFIPTPVMFNMYWLADNNYATNHHNYVNGRIVYSDVCVNGKVNCANAGTADWRTILMGALNGGGRGIYALDVTDPANPKMLWEFTSLNDADFGYSFVNPLAAKKADGTWVVLVASGYDNVKLNIPGDPYDVIGTGKGFLYVLDPLTGTLLDHDSSNKIATNVGAVATPSGLAKMAYWADSPEQDAKALNAYGGDLLGNLWRFDINTKAAVKMATFKDDSNNVQPITTRPEMTNVGANRMIFTATGKYLEVSDLDPTKFHTQSLYAIVDKGASTVSARNVLAKRTLHNARPNRTVTVDGIDPSQGWFVDFPDSGERSNVDMVLAIGTLLVPTNVPTNGVCDAGGYSWLNFLDYSTGDLVTGATTAAIFMTGNDLTTGINVVWIAGRPEVIRTGNNSRPTLVHGVTFAGATAGVKGHRVGWREIFK